MAYGVPYSFVPGTKAKADEVNANFIDVLNKIEDTNLRIDETNENFSTKNIELSEQITEKVEELTENKADLSLSNLDDKGKAVLSAKANAKDLDGKWTYKALTLSNGVSLNSSTALSYSLSNYLPKDSNVYEVLISMNISKSGWKRVYMGTDKIGTKIPICASTNTESSGAIIMPVGTGRKLNISRSTSYTGSIEQLYVTAYRKVR